MTKSKIKDEGIHLVLICGDRHYSEGNARAVNRVINDLIKKYGTNRLVLLEGGAPGIDTYVRTYGMQKNVHVIEVKPLWDIRGRAAGPDRNKVMRALRPQEVIGIHHDLSKSKGTAGMLKLAHEWGIQTREITP